MKRRKKAVRRRLKTRLPWNWRDRLEMKVRGDEYGSTRFRLQFKEGCIPPGCCRIIGQLDVCDHDDDDNYIVESSWLQLRFRNRKLGMLLYTCAMNHLGSLTTEYYAASKEARRMWDSLARRNRHKWCDDADLTIFARKR